MAKNIIFFLDFLKCVPSALDLTTVFDPPKELRCTIPPQRGRVVRGDAATGGQLATQFDSERVSFEARSCEAPEVEYELKG